MYLIVRSNYDKCIPNDAASKDQILDLKVKTTTFNLKL